jgi:hypothetical protein
VDQGDLTGDAGALAPSRSWLTPTRALLLTVGAAVAGVALSLLMGSSPAHAAEGDGIGPGPLAGPLVTATSSVTGAVGTSVTGTISTVSTTLDVGIPVVQKSVDAAGASVAAHVPATAPVVAPVVASVDATLQAVRQAFAPTRPVLPAVPYLIPGANDAAAAQLWTPSAGSGQLASGSPAASSLGGALGWQNSGQSDGVPPGSVLTSVSGSAAATLGLLLGAVALVLLGARRRWHDDALPPSPAFEKDTSPA